MLDTFAKYNTYFEAWLNISAKEVYQAKGIIISSDKRRLRKPDSWLMFLPICAFETRDALIISCIPQWEAELRDITKNASISQALKIIKLFSNKKALHNDRFKFYGINKLNGEIDSAKAQALKKTQYEEFAAYYRKVHPGVAQLVDPNDWMLSEFDDITKKKIHYCVFIENEIVSATGSENMPNAPKGLIQIGVDTLREHRRKGYASAACAAFIKDKTEQGKFPVWTCELNNLPSEMLAKKLGFQHLGNEMLTVSLTEIK